MDFIKNQANRQRSWLFWIHWLRIGKEWQTEITKIVNYIPFVTPMGHTTLDIYRWSFKHLHPCWQRWRSKSGSDNIVLKTLSRQITKDVLLNSRFAFSLLMLMSSIACNDVSMYHSMPLIANRLGHPGRHYGKLKSMLLDTIKTWKNT